MSSIFEQDDAADKDRIYPELARANLFRMRGDYRGAIDQCLSVLKRYPDDRDAHTLIGDIYAEQGDLGQAAQWYELSIDLEPRSSEAEKRKLAQVKQRMQEREAASTAQQLGLPPEKPSIWPTIAVMSVIAVTVGIGSYMLGQQKDAPKPKPRSVSVVAPTESGPSTPESGVGATIVESGVAEDQQVLQSVAARLGGNLTLLSAMQDPRTRLLTVTIAVQSDQNERHVSAEVARAALGQYVSAPSVTVRTVRFGRLVHVSTVTRERMAVTEAPGWANANPGLDALANTVLSDEWSSTGPITTPPPAAAPTTPPTNPDASGAPSNAPGTGDSAGGNAVTSDPNL
ncbi:MAG: tetratricopeptide repeat protein [Fimbriimonadaceae bacterium]|nr:tetratricopeptide repeat protein [Fimbriimonadaceae bacterium]